MDQLPFKRLVKEKFPHLSGGQKKVANYLIENLDEAVFKTAYQIGKKAGVSETTVIRLSYALGFESFSKMHDQIQDQLLQLAQTDHLKEKERDDRHDLFTKVIESEVHILRHLLNEANVQEIWKAVEVLIQADQILIAGHRISHAAAYWFSYTLGSLRENVWLSSPSGDFFEKFCSLTDKSAVVIFSFPRYATEALKMAEIAKKHGICLISVTDRLLSPVGSISDIALTTEENAEAGPNSIASVITLLDLIIAGIYEKDKKRIQTRQEKLENLYTNYDVFSE
ncbi:MurR/RpiR family transcriptional regulator [Fictibacillus sp. NRS-1165]|uniref:MurR/RpiR family transcriptional regulator n=1 Tax=Fictibacillus sp. NRS-1165 TaxID=3144463 RepID=UPI003D1B2C76